MNISENDRGAPGSEQVNWESAFGALKETGYEGWLPIEAFSTIFPEFVDTINVWCDYSPAEEVYTKGLKLTKDGRRVTL